MPASRSRSAIRIAAPASCRRVAMPRSDAHRAAGDDRGLAARGRRARRWLGGCCGVAGVLMTARLPGCCCGDVRVNRQACSVHLHISEPERAPSGLSSCRGVRCMRLTRLERLAQLLAGVGVRRLVDDQPRLCALAAAEDVRAALLGHDRGVLEGGHRVCRAAGRSSSCHCARARSAARSPPARRASAGRRSTKSGWPPKPSTAARRCGWRRPGLRGRPAARC